MSCAGKGYGTAPQSNSYLNSQFYSSITTNNIYQKASRKCRKFKGFYPSFTPSLNNLSVTTSLVGNYTEVYINGSI